MRLLLAVILGVAPALAESPDGGALTCDGGSECDAFSALQVGRTLGEDAGVGCATDLGQGCLLVGCSNAHGPSECRHGRCHCQPGFCLDAKGSCASPAATAHADVLPVTSPGAFPPSQRASLGLCASGGGGRALSFLVGVLRGLNRLGVMDTVDMVATVSGSSWAAAPYFFADRTDEELLGAPTSPPELTLDFLSKPGSQIGASLNRSFAPIIAGLLAEKTPLGELWSRFIGEMFLAPFGLGSQGVYLAKTAEDVERIKRENPKLCKARFATPRPGLPELVICAALLAPKGYASGPESAVSLQISPDVAGSPFYPAGAVVNYSRRCNATGREESISRLVGGGLVETFALGGAQPPHAEAQRGGHAVEVGAPGTPFSLVDAVGASSWNAGAEVAGSLLGSATNPLLEYWPVTSEAMPGPQAAEKYQLGDGGIVDVSGLLPLLQRGVPSVIWVAAAEFGLNVSFPWDESCSCGASCATEFDAVAAGLEGQVTDKFGYGPQLSQATDYHLMNQVFEKKELRSVACELWHLVKAGKPAVVDLQLQVMSNSFWGIAGGETVQVKLLYLENSAEFVQSLPDPTRIQIDLGDDGMFPHFPFYKTMWERPAEFIAYTLPQINLLSALGEYYTVAAYPSAR